MTWRNFKAYFDPHIWVRDPSAAWARCVTCGQRATLTYMAIRERDLYPEWWLLSDGTVRIGGG